MKKMTANDFYREFNCFSLLKNDYKENLKREYFADKIKNGQIYKFVSFDGRQDNDLKKLHSLKNESLWFAPYFVQNDSTELDISYNPYKVAIKTGIALNEIKSKVAALREINDVCCLTTSIRERMWQEYANNHNGICLKFKIKNYELIMPIFYRDKMKIDYTESIIQALKHSYVEASYHYSRIATEPLVIKEKKLYQWEDEVRLVTGDCYDDSNDVLGGIVYANQKSKLGYNGCNYSYKYCKIELREIIIGRNLKEDLVKEVESIAKQQGVVTEIEK